MRFSYILSAVALATSVSAQQQACNGYSALCAKPYNQLVSACTHNAYAFSPPGGIATNQVNDIPTQLNDGIRAFMLDAYNLPSGDTTDIQLCHTACMCKAVDATFVFVYYFLFYSSHACMHERRWALKIF
jgi:hypothetical protein